LPIRIKYVDLRVGFEWEVVEYGVNG